MSVMNEFELLLSAKMQGGLSSVFSGGCGSVISAKRRERKLVAYAEKTRHEAGLFLVGAKVPSAH
jgi:hypothetical protein